MLPFTLTLPESNTGVCTTPGCGTLLSSSRGQKTSTRSACETELVGLSDGVGVTTQLRSSPVSPGHKPPAVPVTQDSTGTVQLAEGGRSGSDTTEHTDTGRLWTTNRVRRERVESGHTVTLEVTADVLTEPNRGLPSLSPRSRLPGYELPSDTS